jgi:thiol-disulfide isomerase/thioredoxin
MRRPWLHESRRDGVRWTQWALLAAVASAVALGGLAAESLLPSGARADEPPSKIAPEFATFDVHGNSRALSNYLNAKPILLEFMSPDCPHCREMAPILTGLHTAYRDRIQFLTVAFDKSAQRIQRFVALEKHTWPYLLGSQEVVNVYRLEGVPTFYFLTPDGTMIDVVVGSLPENALRQNLENLLKAR